jgi:hypothetical protein
MNRTLRMVAICSAALVTATAVALAAPVTAAADTCTSTTAYNGSDFNYTRCNIPDLDQRRAEDSPWTPGLPNGGAMYCVPTAAMDMMAYLASQGFPTVAPGPGYWGPESGWPPQPQYNKITNNIADMGALMGTDPVKGTSTGPARDAIAAWLASAGLGDQLMVSSFSAYGFYTPTFEGMALTAVDGALVMPGIGWYKVSGNGFVRNGGHQLALAKALGSGGSQLIGLRDPANPNDFLVFDQSPFTTNNYAVVDEAGIFDGQPRVLSRVVNLSAHGYLDGFIAIKPMWGVVTDKGSISFLRPIHLVGLDSPRQPDVLTFPSATGGSVTEIALSPGDVRHPYLIEGDNTIWQIDALTGRSSRFATVGNPRRLTFGGREQRLYVLLPRHVISLDRKGRQLDRRLLDTPLADIAWDASHDRLVGLSTDGRRLLFFDPALKPAGELAIPGLPCGGRLSIEVDPTTGEIFISCDRTNRVLRVSAGRGGAVTTLELAGVERAAALSIGDGGRLFVSDGAQMFEFDSAGRPVERSKFSGLPGGRGLDMARSFSNFDPATMTGPAYRNVLPEDAGTGSEGRG